MKKLIVNCLSTTALTLLILAIIATFYQTKCLFISSVFQAFCANLVIHIGLVFLKKLESKYFLLELLWEIGYTIGILILCGSLFKWYGSTPLWMVIIMGIIIYLIACLFDILKINDDLMFINKELKKRNNISA